MVGLVPACAFGEGGIQFAEHTCAAVGKCAVHQAFHHALCARLRREDGVRVVAVLLQTRDLIGAGAEDIFVLRAGLLCNLDVCAIQCAQRHRAVQHELHVAGAGRLRAGRGDLFGHIRRRENPFRIGNLIIFNKYHLDFAADGRVIIHHIRHRIDQFDGQLGIPVAGSRFSAEYKGSGIKFFIRIFFQSIIQIHNVEDVQQLALILMKTLHLYVKNRTGIHFHTVMLQNVIGKAHFILILDIHELLLRYFILGIDLKAADFG